MPNLLRWILALPGALLAGLAAGAFGYWWGLDFLPLFDFEHVFTQMLFAGIATPYVAGFIAPRHRYLTAYLFSATIVAMNLVACAGLWIGLIEPQAAGGIVESLTISAGQVAGATMVAWGLRAGFAGFRYNE